MSECEPCGFCHVLVGFELICFHFMLSMAWSSTCFWSSIFVFIPPLPILLCFPPSSFLQLLVFPPIHLSHILSHPCSPHAPLMTLLCSSYHALFTLMFMPSLHPNPVTSMQAPIFPYPSPCPSYPSPPFFSLRPRIHHHPHLHARESSSVAGKRAWLPSIPHGPRRSCFWGSTPLLRFEAPLSRLSTVACSPSSSTAPAAWSTAPSTETSTCWRRGFESHASPPSRCRRPCPSPLRRRWWRLRLKKLPGWRGMPWAVKELLFGDGLGLAHDGFGLGFEFGAQAQAYAEDGA